MDGLFRIPYTAMADELEKFQAGLLLTAERSQHGAGHGNRILLFHSPHHHAEMSGLDHDTDAGRVELRLERFRDLYGEPLLHLQSSCKCIDDSWNLAEADHFLVRQIPHVHLAEERQQMMLAHAEEIDILDDHHLVVFDR